MFQKNGLGIQKLTKVNMSLDKETMFPKAVEL